MSAHELTVEHVDGATYEMRCSCGWSRQVHSRGGPPTEQSLAWSAHLDYVRTGGDAFPGGEDIGGGMTIRDRFAMAIVGQPNPVDEWGIGSHSTAGFAEKAKRVYDFAQALVDEKLRREAEEGSR